MQVVVAGGCDYYPGSATASPGFSFAVHDLRVAGEGDLLARIERLRRQLRGGGTARAPAAAAAAAAAAHDRGDHRRERQGARRRARGAAGAGAGGGGSCGPSPRSRTATPRRPICRALGGPRRGGARCDVVIIARGGGSLADLLALSDETLCRTVAMCPMPVIASVGHHTDRTLLDDVAAVSCSTPTHAAEAAVARRLRAGAHRGPRGGGAPARPRPPGGALAGAHADDALARARRQARAPAWAAAPAAARTARRRQAAPGQRAGARPPARGGARAQGHLDAARLPPAATARARGAGARARRPRPPADARTGLRAGLLARGQSRSPTRGAARAARRAAAALRRRRAGRRGGASHERADREPRAAQDGKLSYEAASATGRGDHPAPGLRRGEPRRDARAAERGQDA